MTRPAAMVLVSVAAVVGACAGFVTAVLIAAELLTEHVRDAEALDRDPTPGPHPVGGLGSASFQRRA